MITEKWRIATEVVFGVDRGIHLVGYNSGDIVAEHIIDRDIADLFVAAQALRTIALRIDDAMRNFKVCVWCTVLDRDGEKWDGGHTASCWVPELREAIRIYGGRA